MSQDLYSLASIPERATLLCLDLDGMPGSPEATSILKEAFFFAVGVLSGRPPRGARLSECLNGYKVTWKDGLGMERQELFTSKGRQPIK